MSASPNAGAAGRNTPVAHFLAPHWGRIAERLAPVIDREGDEPGASPVALLCVPDAGAATELAAALRAARPSTPRILPVTDALRAARVLKTYGAPVVIATPADVERLLAASALPLDGVQVIVLVAAEEFDADQLATVMAAMPKEARRVLVASEATPVVEVLLERYFHKAHRLADDASSETKPAPVQYQCVRAAHVAAAVPALLDELDPPSAAVVTADPSAVQAALAAHGYPGGAPLVHVSDGPAPVNVALVVFAGLPSPAAFDAAMSAQPGRAVALIAPRQLGALRRLAAGASVTPFTTRRATSAARAQEARVRGELRAVLATSYPAREIVSLEPLLAEYDAVELAGAALRLLEGARSAAVVAAPPATPVQSDRPSRPAVGTARPAERPARSPRPADDFPLRDPAEGPRARYVDRTVRRDRDDARPRRGAPGERGARSGFGDKRGPRAGFGDKRGAGGPRGSFGDKRGPRAGFGDKRGAGGSRPAFGDKPRGGGPRRPRDDR